MALLPLAGWAADLEDATIIVSDMYYGGTAPTVTKVQIGTVDLAFTTDYTVETGKYYEDEACTELVEDDDFNPVPANKLAAGKYYYVKVIGVAPTYSGIKGGKFKVNKKPITIQVTLPTALKMTYDGKTYTNVAVPAGTTHTLKTGSSLATGEVYAKVIKGSLVMSNAATTANKKPNGDAITGKAPAAVKYSGLTADNYEITIEDGTVDIYQLSIVDGEGKLIDGVSVSSTGNTVTYNRTNHLPTFTATFNGKALTAEELAANFSLLLVSGSTMNAGTATFKVVAKENGNFAGEYAGLESAGDLDTYKMTIKKAAAFIKANKMSKVYDGTTIAVATDLYSTGSVKWTGVFEGDAITGTPELHVNKAAKDAGEYNITITAPTGGWGIPNGNYAVGIDNSGIFEITKRPLTITANAKTVAYGSAAPTFTVDDVTISGNVAAELANLKKGISAKFIDGFNYASKGNGTYANVIEPTVDATKATEFKNYEQTLNKGTLTIGAAQILFAIKPASKFYGEADPEDLAKSYIVSGATEGLLTNPVVKRDAGENPGDYLMSFETEATAKDGYEILYATTPVNFTVKKAQLTFTIPAQTIDKNSTKDALKKDNITATGINNSDKVADLYTLAFNSTAGATGDPAKVTTDKTTADGILLTLTPAAQAKYEVKSGTASYASSSTATGKLIVGAGTASDLAFTSIYADYATIVAHAGETQNVTLKITPRNSREVPAGTVHKWAAQTWNAMVLPFEVSVADLSQALGYAIVNRVDAANTTEGNVQFKLEMDKIPANEPFCVKTSKALADDYVATFPNAVKIVAPASEYPSVDAGMGYKFVGAYKTMTITKENPTYSFLRGDIAKWARITNPSSTNTWEVVPFDAYIDLTGADASREITFTFQELDGSTTAIKAVEASVESGNTVKEGWYNLSGMKLEGAPTQKGVYINNGKKVVIK
jgi:hypothetical protein